MHLETLFTQSLPVTLCSRGQLVLRVRLSGEVGEWRVNVFGELR